MNLGAFAAVGAAAGPGRAASGMRLEDLRGLARTRPLLGLPLVFFLACLAGLPPGLVGLVTKVRVFEPPVRGGTGWLALLAVVAALATVVGLAYYLRFAAILLAAPVPVAARGAGAGTARPPAVALGTGWAVGVTLAATLVLSAAPSLVVGLLGP
jgi:NADH-quinone oxidoreductase subunit N